MTAPPAVVAHAGTLEEWTILNDTDEVHAFHLHQVHFLAESANGIAVRPQVWRDTMLVPVRKRTRSGWLAGRLQILVDFRNPAIRGTFVFHCHMLDHEDGGMMATIKVI